MTLFRKQIAAVIAQQSLEVIPAPDPDPEVDLSTIFDVEYLPRNFSRALNDNSQTVNVGDSVLRIVDTNSIPNQGKYDINYIGTNPISLWGNTSAPSILTVGNALYNPLPWYEKLPYESYGYLRMPNVNNARYVTTSPFPGIPHPIEAFLVVRRRDGLHREYFLSNGDAITIRDANDNILGDSTIVGIGEQVQLSEHFRVPVNEITIIHFRLNLNASFFKVNDIQISTTLNIAADSITRMCIGPPNNNTDYDLFYYGLKFGLLQSSDLTTIYNELNRRYNAGVKVQAPFADNIQLFFDSATKKLSASYTYNNPLDNAEDLSLREVLWVRSGKGGAPVPIDQSIFLKQNGNVPIEIIRNDFDGFNGDPSVFPPDTGVEGTRSLYHWKVMIKVFDIEGNSFDFCSPSEFRRDNIN
ncbi:MAG: hypothetical protein AAF363_18750 [Bacteroidota bacterium]